jgi:hypothetical protein
MAFEVLDILIQAKDQTKKAVASANKSLGGLLASAKKIHAGFVLAGTAVAGIATAKLVSGIRNAVQEMDELGKTADRIGVNVEKLQEYNFAAVNAGLTTETLALGVQRFGRRVGEAKDETGELLAGLQKLEREGLGIEIFDESGQNLRNIEDIFEDFLGALGQIDDVATRNAIAMKAFDTEGVAMVNMVRDGSDAFREQLREARRLGVVIDESLIRRAEDLEQELGTMSMVIRANLNQALIEAGPVLRDFTAWLVDAARALKDLVTTEVSPVLLPVETIRARAETFREEINSNLKTLDFYRRELQREQWDWEPFPGWDAAAIRKLEIQIGELETRNRFLQAALDKLDDSAKDAESGMTGAATAPLKPINALFLATEKLRNEVTLLGATSENERARIAAGFNLAATVDTVVNATKDVNRVVSDEFKRAAREGPGALREAIERLREDAPALADSLVAALDLYEAKLGEVDEKQREVFESMRRNLDDLASAAQDQTIRFQIEAEVGDLGDITGVASRLEAVRNLQNALREISDIEEESAKVGVDVTREATQARVAAQQEFYARMEQITREGAQGVADIRREIELAGMSEDKRRLQKELDDIRRWWEDRKHLVEQGLIEEQELMEAYALKVSEAREANNVFAQAFEVDIKQTAADALKHMGDQAADTFVSLLDGSATAKEAFRDLGLEIASMTQRLLVQMAVAKALEGITSLFGGGGEGEDVSAGAISAATLQVEAGSTMAAASTAQSTAAAQMVAAATTQQAVATAEAAAAQIASSTETTAATIMQTAAGQMAAAATGQVTAGGQMSGAATIQSAAAAQMVVAANIMAVASAGSSGASAHTGGITTREGLIYAHPSEAIIPLDKLPEIIPAIAESGGGGVNISQTFIISGGAGGPDVVDRSDPGDAKIAGFTSAIRDAMISAIVAEQRPGGVLEGTRARR